MMQRPIANNENRRPRWLLHWQTVAAILLASNAFLMLNDLYIGASNGPYFEAYEFDTDLNPQDVAYYTYAGMPFSYQLTKHTRYEHDTLWLVYGMIGDLALGILALTAIGLAIEYALRRRPRIFQSGLSIWPTLFAVAFWGSVLVSFNVVANGRSEGESIGWPLTYFETEYWRSHLWNRRNLALDLYILACALAAIVYVFNRVARDRVRQPLQFRLSTLVVFTLAAGAFLCLNLSSHAPASTYVLAQAVYGWPFQFYPSGQYWRWLQCLRVFANVLVFACSAGLWFCCSEFLIHRRKPSRKY